MKKKYLKNTFFYILFFSTFSVVFAQTTADKKSKLEVSDSLSTVILSGIELTINNQFHTAENNFRQMIESDPNSPFGYFYVGATIQAQMLDHENYERIDEFEKMMEKAIKLSKPYQKNNNDTWSYFIEGSAYLYRSFVDSKLGDNWGAYRNATKGGDRLENVIQIDSTFYDAYMGIGSVKYWKSSRLRKFSWLPFVSDDREQGIEMVETSVAKGKYVEPFGKDQLAWIYIDQKEYEKAEKLARENHEKFPESRFFLWTLVQILDRSVNDEAALPLYKKLLTKLRKMTENNKYNEINCLLRLSEISLRNEDIDNAKKYANELLQLTLNKDVEKRQEKKIKRAKEIQMLVEK